jgi:hypothetical protein
MKNLCTLFDSGYLPLGLALYRSIQRHFDAFHLWVLALDENALNILREMELPNLTVISLAAIESDDLLVAKNNRTWQEFCWTLSPVLPTYVLEQNPALEHITYIDSDIYFFSNPDPIYNEIGDSSIMITPHRFPKRLSHLEQNGIYNVQMVYFKNDETGRACLAKWRQQCIEWCYYRLEPDRMGDQKYLDKWPQEFANVCILQNIGAGAALWNIENYALKVNGTSLELNNKPLIFYHYHGFKIFTMGLFTSGLANYGLPFDLLDAIYRPYVTEILKICKEYRIKPRPLSVRDAWKHLRMINLHSNLRPIRAILHTVSKVLGIIKR